MTTWVPCEVLESFGKLGVVYGGVEATEDSGDGRIESKCREGEWFCSIICRILYQIGLCDMC